MTVLTVLHYPDPRLHKVAKPVAVVDERVRKIVADMAETMYDAHGVGLAATQVDIHERIIVIDVSEEQNQLMVFINPELVWASPEKKAWREGCLSVPGLRAVVPRAMRIRYTGFDEYGHAIDRIADGFHAKVVQHECDHLLGILYPMRVTDFSKFGYNSVLFPNLAPESDD